MSKKLLGSVVMTLLLSACSMEPIDPTTSWSADRLYAEARDEMDEGRYEQAIKHFEKLEARYPFGIYAQQAQMEIAYAHYRQGEKAQALAAVERFLRLHPNHVRADYMYYLRGLIHVNELPTLFSKISLDFDDPSQHDLQALQQAFDAFKQLVVRFPDSAYTDDARKRMAQLVDYMAQHEIHTASYYYRRGAYLAAVNRAQEAVRNYQDSPAVEKALEIMIRSYDALGLTQLRDDAKRVLQGNFPGNPLLKEGRG